MEKILDFQTVDWKDNRTAVQGWAWTHCKPPFVHRVEVVCDDSHLPVVQAASHVFYHPQYLKEDILAGLTVWVGHGPYTDTNDLCRFEFGCP